MYAPSYVFSSPGCIFLYAFPIYCSGFLNCVPDYTLLQLFSLWLVYKDSHFLIVYVQGGDFADISIDFKAEKGTIWN